MAALGYPLPRAYPVTQRFGAVSAPTFQPHTGLDIGAPSGTPWLASADGVVEMYQPFNAGGGRVVRVRVDQHLTFEGAHLQAVMVGVGQAVKRGQILGTTGSSGALVTGPHLHFEVQVDGRPVDPETYLSGGAPAAGAAIVADPRLPSYFPVARDKVSADACPPGFSLGAVNPGPLLFNAPSLLPFMAKWDQAPSTAELAASGQLPLLKHNNDPAGQSADYRLACIKDLAQGGPREGNQVANAYADAATGAAKLLGGLLVGPLVAVAVIGVSGILVYKGVTQVLGVDPVGGALARMPGVG